MDLRTPTLLTADEFFRHPAAREASELVRGRIVVLTPAGGRHNVIALRVAMRLTAFVEERGLGMAFTDNLGYYLPIPGEPRDTVRAPDDRPGALAARVRDYFAAGTRRVWVVDPDARTVAVHAPDGTTRLVAEDDVVDGAPVLPGLALPVAPLFAGLPRRA